MPAIHIPRLQKQVDELVLHYAEPELFFRRLRDIFDYYGDHTHRPSELVKQKTGLPKANVPMPVLRHIIQGITPYAETAPHAVLVLARTLWDTPNLEYRQLAAQMLGKIPLSHMEQVHDLLTAWSKENFEEVLFDAFAEYSLANLLANDQPLLLTYLEGWLHPEREEAPEDGEETAEQEAPEQEEEAKEAPPPLTLREIVNLNKLALKGLVQLVQSSHFENLPKIYTIITPAVQELPKVLRPYLLDVLTALVRRSPQEVTYLMVEQLTAESTPTNAWLARRTLPLLPDDMQPHLRPLVFPRKTEE